ncbi:uncharacterized protein LOC113460272 [Zonotrichia albicollis]|uniref:uncharacterized protein LOC113460272 n=1 Tax=Zonotrichia albicollis TaxID=44394 RepID=UPI003D80D3B3
MNPPSSHIDILTLLETGKCYLENCSVSFPNFNCSRPFLQHFNGFWSRRFAGTAAPAVEGEQQDGAAHGLERAGLRCWPWPGGREAAEKEKLVGIFMWRGRALVFKAGGSFVPLKSMERSPEAFMSHKNSEQLEFDRSDLCEAIKEKNPHPLLPSASPRVNITFICVLCVLGHTKGSSSPVFYP